MNQRLPQGVEVMEGVCNIFEDADHLIASECPFLISVSEVGLHELNDNDGKIAIVIKVGSNESDEIRVMDSGHVSSLSLHALHCALIHDPLRRLLDGYFAATEFPTVDDAPGSAINAIMDDHICSSDGIKNNILRRILKGFQLLLTLSL